MIASCCHYFTAAQRMKASLTVKKNYIYELQKQQSHIFSIITGKGIDIYYFRATLQTSCAEKNAPFSC
jgi:hypothetical protein